ncbi:MAG: hypothetical protein GY778_12675 [bacterium]|nr:hypothetical protein [bacterium]
MLYFEGVASFNSHENTESSPPPWRPRERKLAARHRWWGRIQGSTIGSPGASHGAHYDRVCRVAPGTPSRTSPAPGAAIRPSDSGQTWVQDGLDLLNANIGDLAIDPVNLTITAGTYGRGAWRSALPPVIVRGDIDGDGDVDLGDHALLYACMNGPDNPTPPAGCGAADSAAADQDTDDDVDLDDFGEWSGFHPAQ